MVYLMHLNDFYDIDYLILTDIINQQLVVERGVELLFQLVDEIVVQLAVELVVELLF
jgi:hypothetical protein